MAGLINYNNINNTNKVITIEITNFQTPSVH